MRPALRLAVLALSAGLVGCPAKVSTGGLQVLVELEPGLISRCVKVTATDGAQTRESKAIPLAGKTSPLHVGVFRDGFAATVSVQAIGFSDEGCTTLALGEQSESVDGTFGTPPQVVTVKLRPGSNGDGGTGGGTGQDGGSDAGADAGMDAGTDAGLDAGIDNDRDGYPLPADCNDADPAIHPGASESCNNGVDDDCDQLKDCAQATCAGFFCSGGGLCMGTSCIAPTEVLCNDGVDNDNDTLIDCADPDCPVGGACDNRNACTLGEVCGTDGGCQKTSDVLCNTPPNTACYDAVGTCLPDAGASCAYPQRTGSCNDLRGCTDNDTCTAGTCSGTPHVCPAPSNVCLSAAGTCQEPGVCAWTPLVTGPCNDGLNCTINDTCDGDGGCMGTPVTCTPPSQCHAATGACADGGACLFNPRTGQACDAGNTAGPATCTAGFNCVAATPPLFPYVPSNFTEPQVPTTDGGVVFTVSCNTTIDSSNTPSITSSCLSMPPFGLITPSGGESTLVLGVNSLTVNIGQTLTIQGSRPVIFAVLGNVLINGTVRARNAGGTSAACGNGGAGTDVGSGNGVGGGGGGGFGSAGGVGGLGGGAGAGPAGGVNGAVGLKPLRGGCNGGNGFATGGAAGGAGGGAIQISATGSVTLNGTITAPGRGGAGAANSGGKSGGGGGSGGALLLEGATVALGGASHLTAQGGGGGEGEGGNAGNPGADGLELFILPAAGGFFGSTAGGNGGAGATRDAVAGPGLDGSSNNDGAGGGGGGVGRVRINASTSCNIPGTGPALSPTPSGNGVAGCPPP